MTFKKPSNGLQTNKLTTFAAAFDKLYLPVIHFSLSKTQFCHLTFLFIIIASFLCSCGKTEDEPTFYTKAQANKRIDSLAQIEYNKIAREADKDLTMRLQIEVKQKGDSILHYQDSVARKRHR